MAKIMMKIMEKIIIMRHGIKKIDFVIVKLLNILLKYFIHTTFDVIELNQNKNEL
jgi:hypothetical protein